MSSKSQRVQTVSAVSLHEDPVIRRHQLSKWANWYHDGPGHEYPEFDIYGPFLAESEETRGADTEKWEEINSRLKTLAECQSTGRDPAGSTLRKDFGSPKTCSMFSMKEYRTVCDDQRNEISGGDVILADLNSFEAITVRDRLAGKLSSGRTVARVQAYRDLDDAYIKAGPNPEGSFRPRPFYKDYRHYSRYGFAGQGAKSAWAANPRQTKADYDPEKALYTKPPSSSVSRYDELYVHTPARCDSRPKLTPTQRKLLSSFEQHNIAGDKNAARRSMRDSWSAPVTLLDHQKGEYN
mmetsp:Transcript_18520/g.47414  ORF Transcript_18520/g.47414 Transcript_18520/m.47414 type:complete len:295 (-) Transcript_18520:3032-3916(-)|eukprot:jgi/Tetstr1/434463/TSEL_002499.t1